MSFINAENLTPYIRGTIKQKTVSTLKTSLPITKSKQSYVDIPLTNIRQTIAKRLTASKVKF